MCGVDTLDDSGAAVAAVDLLLDCRAMRCPLPVIRLANAIEDVEVGRCVAVLADDPAARPDVPAWCRMRGHEYVGEELDQSGSPRFVVRRTH
jgi:tRNA 2-thiouridine synthesizing protein A